VTGRSRGVDALRGCAILGVVAYHYLDILRLGEALQLAPALRRAAAFGWAGVDLFFVLSAFLLTRGLLDQRDNAGALSGFFGRRILRTWPLYFLLLALALVGEAAVAGDHGGPRDWLLADHAPTALYALFLQNYWMGAQPHWSTAFLSSSWSLAVEEQFYLILPFIALSLTPARFAALAGAAILLVPPLRYVVSDIAPPSAWSLWTPFRLDAFAWGVVIALAARQPALRTPVITTLAGLAPLCLLALGERWSLDGPTLDPLTTTATTILGAVAVACVALAPARNIAPAAITRVFAWFGERCFSIYLLHFPLAGVTQFAFGASDVHATDAASAARLVAALLLSFPLAALSYRLIERPFIALGARLSGAADARGAIACRNATSAAG